MLLLQLEDNEEIAKVSSEEQRQSFSEKLSEVSIYRLLLDWLILLNPCVLFGEKN